MASSTGRVPTAEAVRVDVTKSPFPLVMWRAGGWYVPRVVGTDPRRPFDPGRHHLRGWGYGGGKYKVLIDEVKARAALRDTNEARVAVEATLASRASPFDDPVRGSLAEALRGRLHAAAEEPRAGRVDLGSFLPEVAYRAHFGEEQAR